MAVQTCPICSKQFYVSTYVATKKYCTESCKRKAKAQRKRGTDANVLFDTSEFFEVGHHPSAAQLSEVAEYMLKGGTDKASVYTGVMVNWVPPTGIIWKVEQDGRAYMAKAQKSLVQQIVEAQARGQVVEVKFIEPAQPPLDVPTGASTDPLTRFLKRDATPATLKAPSVDVSLLTPQEILAMEEAKAQRAMEEL